MAQVLDNVVRLSPTETIILRKKLDHPDEAAMQRQKAVLDWIAEHLTSCETGAGFKVTVDEAP